MNKLFKALTASAAGLFAAAALTITVCAEDYTFEISEPVQTNGDWSQSFVYYTANDEGHPGNFDATWMTSDSEVIVEYTYEGDSSSRAPLELIWQTWENGPVEPNPDVKRSWNKITPYEYDETTAKFSFEDIAAKYGTDDFATVYAINVGDTGVKLTVTGVTITNCDIPEEEAEAETEVGEEDTEAESEEEAAEEETETEKVTEKETEATTTVKETKAPETEATTTEATTNIADNAPKEGGGGAVAVTVIIIVIVVAAVVVGIYFMIKKNKGKYY
ncbi:hypothetical protein [Huintestinicola sp.]|uniref:hypothetical protein n=1 Tax=Huintestinicola sp. TaxID=2981661 RepID=UPI003D7E6DDD